MITLKTLSEATAQEVFNQVYEHLLTQNIRSTTDDGACLYRSPEGYKCAAGCLIADDEYQKSFEKRDWYGLIAFKNVPKNHENLIYQLQRVHDSFEPDSWKNELLKLADIFELEIPELS